jgi:hypothetical protein
MTVTRRSVRKALGVVAFNAVAAALMLETLFVVLLHAPRLVAASPRPLSRLVQQIYRHFNRALIQFEPSCAQYDPGLSYTLKPGACTFGNVEFRNEFHINRLGLRDDDGSLEAPEIIVLGDSQAMGWGVEQDQTLVRVLGRETGSKILDAAVSSYGTVREMMMLDRLDTSGLRTLVIQYSDNDVVENRTFRDRGRLPIMSAAKYEEIARYYAAQRSYYPGKYTYRLFMKVSRLERPEPDQEVMPEATPSEEADLFLNALMHAGHVRLDDVQIIAFEVNEHLSERRFVRALEAAAKNDAYPPFVRRLVTLDASSLLTPADFYVLDDHMNARGHRVIGEALASSIHRRTIGDARPR